MIQSNIDALLHEYPPCIGTRFDGAILAAQRIARTLSQAREMDSLDRIRGCRPEYVHRAALNVLIPIEQSIPMNPIRPRQDVMNVCILDHRPQTGLVRSGREDSVSVLVR